MEHGAGCRLNRNDDELHEFLEKMHSLLPIDQELEWAGISETSSDEEDVDGSRPEVDIIINNVVCSFSVRRLLNLQRLSQQASNVEYMKSHGIASP